MGMHRADSDIARFAQTNFHNKGRVFGIKRGDRRAHMYVVGKTGTGKSTLIKTLIHPVSYTHLTLPTIYSV